MPESIRNQYQYFTEAPMHKLRTAGYSKPFSPLAEGVRDYVTQHLVKEDKHW
jgi:ADP-L-glycero-D-manno-heptose 6-epimerase